MSCCALESTTLEIKRYKSRIRIMVDTGGFHSVLLAIFTGYSSVMQEFHFGHSFLTCIFTQVCLQFNPSSTKVATGSMDMSAKIWDVEKGVELSTLSVSINI